jgi:PAS domain S-box-containing protein
MRIPPGFEARLVRRAAIAALVFAALGGITLAAVAIDVRTRVSVAALAWIYLIIILPVTLRWGRLAGLLTAAASLLLLLTFLTEPRGLPYTTYGVDVIRLAISSLGVTIAIILIDQVNRRLASSDRLLAEIVQSSDGAITIESADGSIMSWSSGAEYLYGFSAEEVLGKSVSMLLPPELVAEPATLMDRLRRGERIADHASKRVARDGRIIDVALTLSPVRDADGRVTGARTICRDITAPKRVGSVLRINEMALKRALEELPEAAILLDDRGRVLHMNDRAGGYLAARGEKRAVFVDLFGDRFALHPPTRWTELRRTSFSSFLALGTAADPLRLRVEVSRLDESDGDAAGMWLLTLRDATQQLEGAYLQLLQHEQGLAKPPAAALEPLNELAQRGTLTPREVEVLALIASGRSNQQIATELGITVNTIERHIANIYRKLQITSRTQATAYALHHGALAHQGDGL